MKRHNLHTHTSYSDGWLSPEQLVETARREGLEVLGICDHAFTAKLPSSYQVTRRLEQYLAHLRRLQRSLEDIELVIGVEVDVSGIYGIDPSKLPFDALNRFDYVLFEYVDTAYEPWGAVHGRRIEEIVEVRDRLAIPVGLAHNDMQRNYEGREEEIAALLADNDIFVELCESEPHPRRGVGRNTRDGMDYYRLFSRKLVEELRRKGVRVVAGTDSHTGEKLVPNDVYQFVRDNGLLWHEIVDP